jgi:hypothetical protein
MVMQNDLKGHMDVDENLSLLALAEWYWHLHDDMEYPEAESVHHLTKQQILQMLRQQFISSDCGDFAMALHELTGWSMVNFYSPSHGPVHSAVLHPSGKIIDFDGFVTLPTLRKRYRIPDLLMGQPNAQLVFGTSDLDFDERVTGIDRAKATIRFLDYAPFTSIR